VVATDQVLDMICDSQNVVQTTCQATGNFEPALDALGDCSKPIKATVEEITDNTCSYNMYRVGYKMSNVEFLELYRSCYDTNHQAAHFVIHQTYPNNVGKSRKLNIFSTRLQH